MTTLAGYNIKYFLTTMELLKLSLLYFLPQCCQNEKKLISRKNY